MMGTNYYIEEEEKDPCECCGRPYEQSSMHIGKSSAGWKFLFRSYPEKNLTTFDRWVKHILLCESVGCRIVDEYGSEIGAADLIMKIIDKQDLEKNHKESWNRDTDGLNYVFSDREFS